MKCIQHYIVRQPAGGDLSMRIKPRKDDEDSLLFKMPGMNNEQ